MVSLPLGLRVSNALVSYVRYIGKIFYPTSLAVLYPLDANGYPLWKVILCLVLLLALTAVVIIERRRHRFLLTGWFWYLGTLVPVIGLVQVGVQAMADRYMYLPGIGIYIIVAWLAGEAVAKLRLPKIVPATDWRGDFGCVAADDQNAGRVLEEQRIVISAYAGCDDG